MPPITALKNQNVLLLSLAYGMLFFGFNAAEQHFTAFYQQSGDQRLAFQSLAVLYAALILGNFVGPLVARQLGIKSALILGGIAYTALVLGMTWRIPWLIYILSISLGVAGGIAGIARTELIYQIAPVNKRGEYNGVVDSIRTLGGFLGIVSVGMLLKWHGINGAFWLLALVMTVGTGLMFWLRPPQPANLSQIKTRQNWTVMYRLARDPRVLFLVPFTVAGGFLLGLVLGAIPVRIQSDFGIGWVGPITAIFHLTLAGVSLLAGYWSDLKGRYIFIYAAGGCGLIALFMYLQWFSLPLLAGIMLLLGLASSLGGPAFAAVMLDTFEGDIKEATAVHGIYSIVLGVVPSFLLPIWLDKNQLTYVAIALMAIGMVVLRRFEMVYGKSVVTVS